MNLKRNDLTEADAKLRAMALNWEIVKMEVV